jgi:hypothetical protein
MKVALVQQAIPGATGTQSYTDANISSDLKAALVFSSSASANNTTAAIARFMAGMTDGTTHRSTAVAAADAVTTSQTSGGASTNVYRVINANGGTNETAAFSAILSNGLRLNWTAISTARLVNALMISGADVEASVVVGTFTSAAAPETLVINHGLSAAPDVIYAISWLGLCYSHGFYDRVNNSYAAASYTNLTGQVGTVSLGGYVSDNAIIRQVSATASDYAVTLGAFNATSFSATATGATTNDTIAYLCLRVTDGVYKVGIENTPTSTGNFTVASGIAGTPALLMMATTRMTTLNGIDSSDESGVLGLGVMCNNNGTIQQCVSCLSSDDAASTTIEKSYTSNTKCLVICDTAGNADVEATPVSFNNGSITLNASNVSATSYLMPYLAVGTGTRASRLNLMGVG